MTKTPFTFAMIKVFLFIIIATVINFSLVNAQEFSFDAPEEIETGEEFEVDVQMDTNQILDIKLVVYEKNGERGKIVSKIYFDNEWKSPYYFLVGAYPEHKIFVKKVLDYQGSGEICLKLRDEAKKAVGKEICKPISIGESSEPIEELELKEEIEESSEEIIEERYLEEPIKNPEKIVLNSPSTKQIVTKDETIRLGVIYSFMFIMLVVIVLLAFKKL